MTTETETVLIKLLEELKAQAKETNESLTLMRIGLARLEEKVSALQKGQDESKEEIREIKNDIKGRVSIQTYWFLLLITTLIGIVGKFAFFPNP